MIKDDPLLVNCIWARKTDKNYKRPLESMGFGLKCYVSLLQRPYGLFQEILFLREHEASKPAWLLYLPNDLPLHLSWHLGSWGKDSCWNSSCCCAISYKVNLVPGWVPQGLLGPVSVNVIPNLWLLLLFIATAHLWPLPEWNSLFNSLCNTTLNPNWHIMHFSKLELFRKV